MSEPEYKVWDETILFHQDKEVFKGTESQCIEFKGDKPYLYIVKE